MNTMDDNRRYHPYYRRRNHHSNDKRFDYDYKRQSNKNNKQNYQYSSSWHDNRNYNNFSYRRPIRNNYHYQNQSSKPRTSYFSAPPVPLMSTQIEPLPSSTSSSSPSPPPQVTSTTTVPSSPSVVPHQRESWIRSVKKTKMNESIEQKTQYLETILRMPQQQKSLLNTSVFDRMRFADNQLPALSSAAATAATTTSAIEENDTLENSSFHLICDTKNHDDIRYLEKLLFDNELPPEKTTESVCLHQETLPDPLPSSTIECTATSQNDSKPMPCSGFLIDDCDEEEMPPVSPPPRPLLPPSPTNELCEENDDILNEQRVMLVSELDAADAERKQDLKRQKRLNRKLKKKNNASQQIESEIENTETNTNLSNDQGNLLSDWITEYSNNENNQILQMTNEVRRTSTDTSDNDKTAKMNMILMKIKKQQDELRKLRQYVIAMLGEQPTPRASRVNQQDSNLTRDLLLAFLNQPIQSTCWLCSGKTYAEVATQCDEGSEQ